MKYFEKRLNDVEGYSLSKYAKETLIHNIKKKERLYHELYKRDRATAKRYLASLEAIDMLRKWQAYITDLNECAYSDDMLRLVAEKTAKIYESI